MPPKKSSTKANVPPDEEPETVLIRLKRAYQENCRSSGFPPEREFIRRINRYLEDGADDFGREIPPHFVFPYGNDPLGPLGARVAVNTFLSHGFHIKFLRHLCFYRAALGDEGIDALVDLVKPRECALEALEVVDCGMTASGCTYLGIALKTNINLKTLVLDFNAQMGDEGVINLTRHGLVANRSIEWLSLKYCGITTDGARCIAAELVPHARMPTLIVGGNMIGNDGALALASALRANDTITNLDVSDCFFGDDPAVLEMFKDALVENTTLSKINLTGNLFPEEGTGEILFDLVKENTNIISLGTIGDMPTARIDGAAFKACRKQVATNKKNRKKKKKGGKKGKKGKGKAKK